MWSLVMLSFGSFYQNDPVWTNPEYLYITYFEWNMKCYHLVYVIGYVLTQSDYIKQHQLYLELQVQRKPFNVIICGQVQTDYMNPMIIMNDSLTTKTDNINQLVSLSAISLSGFHCICCQENLNQCKLASPWYFMLSESECSISWLKF
jgi:hypothetical protein